MIIYLYEKIRNQYSDKECKKNDGEILGLSLIGGYWSKKDYEDKIELKNYLSKHQMGWDVTDFVKVNLESKVLHYFVYEMVFKVTLMISLTQKNYFLWKRGKKFHFIVIK